MRSQTEWGEVWQPHGVPVPRLDLTGNSGRRLVFRPHVEKARTWLTGNLPPPTRRNTGGFRRCPKCGDYVAEIEIDTHVKGAWPVKTYEGHSCKTAVA